MWYNDDLTRGRSPPNNNTNDVDHATLREY